MQRGRLTPGPKLLEAAISCFSPAVSLSASCAQKAAANLIWQLSISCNSGITEISKYHQPLLDRHCFKFRELYVDPVFAIIQGYRHKNIINRSLTEAIKNRLVKSRKRFGRAW